MADVLTMARSFGSFFYFLCQNLSTAIPDARILEQLHTNIRWSLTLRGSPRDAQFLRPALPITGRVERPSPAHSMSAPSIRLKKNGRCCWTASRISRTRSDTCG